MTTSNSNTTKKDDKQNTDGKRDLKLSVSLEKRVKFFRSKLKRKVFKHTKIIRSLIILFSISIIILIGNFVYHKFTQTRVSEYVSLAKLFAVPDDTVVRESDGRVNVLLLGKGGEGHEAPELTDTIMLASIDTKSERIDLISIPRDIWIPSIRAKINSAYYWGNKKNKGRGLVLVKSSVEEVMGQPVHYVAVIDFTVFTEVIDTLGGVSINVENSFTDIKYPIEGKENDDCGRIDPEYLCRYETVSFDEGRILMDGETALKFVRSRNAEGDEGTDFARSKRQQAVIFAIKEKMQTREVLTNYDLLMKLKELAIQNIETDLIPDEMAVIARYIYDARNDLNTYTVPEELLINPPISSKYDNLYVFIPESDDPETPQNEWDSLHEWVRSVLN